MSIGTRETPRPPGMTIVEHGRVLFDQMVAIDRVQNELALLNNRLTQHGVRLDKLVPSIHTPSLDQLHLAMELVNRCVDSLALKVSNMVLDGTRGEAARAAKLRRARKNWSD